MSTFSARFLNVLFDHFAVESWRKSYLDSQSSKPRSARRVDFDFGLIRFFSREEQNETRICNPLEDRFLFGAKFKMRRRDHSRRGS